MTSSYGNSFRVTGHLCREFTGPRKGQWRGALMFSLICTRINGWVNNREAGDLKRHPSHCEVIVMFGVKTQTSNLAMYGETGHSHFWSDSSGLAILVKIVQLENVNPLKIVYRELYGLSNAGHETWCTHVCSLLESNGIRDVWILKTDIFTTYFIVIPDWTLVHAFYMKMTHRSVLTLSVNKMYIYI